MVASQGLLLLGVAAVRDFLRSAILKLASGLVPPFYNEALEGTRGEMGISDNCGNILGAQRNAGLATLILSLCHCSTQPEKRVFN